MSKYIIRPNKNRGQSVLLLLTTMLVLQIVSSIHHFFLIRYTAENFNSITVNSFRFDDTMMILSLVILVVYITTIVFYIRWFRRAYFNLNQIASPLRYKNGWAAGSWFIPGFHWIGPFQIMIELYTKTRSFLVKNMIPVSGKGIYVVLAIWWILYFTSGAIAIYNMYQGPSALDDLNSFQSFADQSQMIGLINLLLSIFAILVVLIYYHHERKIELITDIHIGKVNPEENGLIDTVDGVTEFNDTIE